jgi:DNA-binding GntR family transcriptional regulator
MEPKPQATASSAPEPLANLTRRALGDDVAELLRREIMRGTFPPGSHLRETELATALQVSRGPVRDALLQLEHEGLVMRRRNRGAVVVRLSRDDLEEVYELRLLLEQFAMGRAALHAVENDLIQMEKAISDFERVLVENVSVHAASEIDLAFHDLVYRAAHNERLFRFWSDLRPQVYIFLLARQYTHASDFPEIMIDGHRSLFEAIRSRDSERAEKVAAEHVHASYLRVIEGYTREEQNPSTTSDLGGLERSILEHRLSSPDRDGASWPKA